MKYALYQTGYSKVIGLGETIERAKADGSDWKSGAEPGWLNGMGDPEEAPLLRPAFPPSKELDGQLYIRPCTGRLANEYLNRRLIVIPFEVNGDGVLDLKRDYVECLYPELAALEAKARAIMSFDHGSFFQDRVEAGAIIAELEAGTPIEKIYVDDSIPASEWIEQNYHGIDS